jgi:Fur family ferric uptake transcriptional regulator
MPKDFSLRAVPVNRSPWEQFTQFLESRGKRVTRQRQKIVEQVFSHHDHFDVDELMDHLRDLIAQGEVSRPTVYRTLGELVEAGLLRQMMLGGRSVYEHEYGYPSHDHLHCQVCNRLIEFHSDDLERIRDAVAREHCFNVLSHRMFVTGICAECRARTEKHEQGKARMTKSKMTKE